MMQVVLDIRNALPLVGKAWGAITGIPAVHALLLVSRLADAARPGTSGATALATLTTARATLTTAGATLTAA